MVVLLVEGAAVSEGELLRSEASHGVNIPLINKDAETVNGTCASILADENNRYPAIAKIALITVH